MKQIFLALLLVTCGLNNIKAQSRTYVGLEFSFFRDFHKIKDNGNYLMTLPLMDPQGGITLRQEIKEQFFVESGVIVKPYASAIGFKPIPVSFVGTEGVSFLIPIRLGVNINVFKEKVYLVPVIGYSFSPNASSTYGRDAGLQESSTAVIAYTSTSDPAVSSYASLLQTGIGLDYKIFKACRLSLSGNYFKGSKPIWITDINYSVNFAPPTNATVTSKGDFWCISAGLRYPLSNLWTTNR